MGGNAAVQDAAEIRRGEELGMEQVVPVGPYKVAHLFPVSRGSQPFQAGQLQGPAVLHPQAQEWTRQLLEQLDEITIVLPATVPGPRRFDHSFHDSLEAQL